MSHQKLHIEQLIALCKNGNQAAQLEVYNRYYKAMYNIAIRILKSSAEAEDAMQESFLNAFTKLDSFSGKVTFGAWLKKIVINKSIYMYKMQKRKEEVALDTVLYKVEDDDGMASVEEFTSLQAQKVLQTLKTLKNNYRVSLTLHLIEGYDYEEISEILNISYANCRTMISRAKDSLRKKLEACS